MAKSKEEPAALPAEGIRSDDSSPDAEEHPIIITVENRFKRGRGGKEVVVKQETEIGPVHKFVTTPAIVRRGYGVTINQGDFNSARIDVSVTVPCYLEDVELADEWAAKFAEQKLTEEVTSLGDSGGRTSFTKNRERSPL